MSDYEKPVKQCQDAPIGMRTVNALVESQDAQMQLLSVEHAEPFAIPPVLVSIGDLTGGSVVNFPSPRSGGEHDTPKIARGTMALTSIAASSHAIGNFRTAIRFNSGVCKTYVRVSTGVYFFPISELTDFYAEATPFDEDGDGVLRFCQVQPVSTATVSSSTGVVVSPGIYVSTWEEATLNSGNPGFQLADFTFNVVVYGNYGTELREPLVPVVASPPWVRRRRQRPVSSIVKPL